MTGAQRPGRPDHVSRALLLLAGTSVAAETVLALAGGARAAAAGAAAIVIALLATARYTAGADAMDATYRRSVRLVHQREPSLQGWAAAVDAARESAQGFERVLRPELERLYAVRLAERYGVSLYRDSERAAALIGAQLWPWIDPARPTYSEPLPRRALDRRAEAAHSPPPTPDVVLEALVRRLETL